MADVVSTNSGNGQLNVLTELAAEVKIPVNEVYIALDAPESWFVEDPSRAQKSAELHAQAAALRQMAAAMKATGRPEMTVGAAPMEAQATGLEAIAAKLAQPTHPQLFLVETYRLTTLRTASGKGAHIQSISLFPGEEKTVEIRTSFLATQDRTRTTTVMESDDETVAQNFNEHIAKSANEHQSKDSYDYNLNANFHGDASVGLGSGEANASLAAKGGSNDVRSDFGHAVESAADKQIGQTSASRNQFISSGSSDDKTSTEMTTVSTDKIKNPNPTHTVNVLWYQLLDQYMSFLAIADVEVGYRTTLPEEAARVPLHDLDKLLGRVAAPDKRDPLRQAIKNELGAILDFQGSPTNIVDEVSAGAGLSVLRLKPNLQTSFTLKNSSGDPVRSIKVDGLLIKAFSRVIPSRQVVSDLVVGETAAA
jgi:hypothetical protein